MLSLKQKAAHCRVLPTGDEITLRATRLWDVVPGEIAVVQPNKHWTYAGNPYLSGNIESKRLDVGALNLAPLKLEALGVWDPAQEYWGEEGEPIDESGQADHFARPAPAIRNGTSVAGRSAGQPGSGCGPNRASC